MKSQRRSFFNDIFTSISNVQFNYSAISINSFNLSRPAVKKIDKLNPNIFPVLWRSKLLVSFFAVLWLFFLSQNINKKEPSVSGSSSVPPRSKNCPIWWHFHLFKLQSLRPAVKNIDINSFNLS